MQRSLDEAIAKELEQLEARGLRRHLLTVDPASGGRVILDGRSYLDFASNDYLALGGAELDRLPFEGTSPGARASRLVTGNTSPHVEAETALAEHVGLEAALLFTSGYAANVGTIPSLVGRGDLVLSDELNHASLIDGCRLSRATIRVYPHNDLETLERLLAEHQGHHPRILVVTESVFSMEGDRAPLGPIRTLSERYGAWLMVDEAHSLGILGPRGQGLCAEAEVVPEVLVGTLGKAFGAAGAFAAGSRLLRELLVHRARSFVFSTGLSPLLAAIVSRRTQQVRDADEARALQGARCRELAAGLRGLGLEVRGDGPVVTAVYGDATAAVAAEGRLRAAGIVARAIRPPTVPAGTSRVRFVPTAAHGPEDVRSVLDALR